MDKDSHSGLLWSGWRVCVRITCISDHIHNLWLLMTMNVRHCGIVEVCFYIYLVKYSFFICNGELYVMLCLCQCACLSVCGWARWWNDVWRHSSAAPAANDVSSCYVIIDVIHGLVGHTHTDKSGWTEWDVISVADSRVSVECCLRCRSRSPQTGAVLRGLVMYLHMSTFIYLFIYLLYYV